jgi:Flp pilus assembly protein TadD
LPIQTVSIIIGWDNRNMKGIPAPRPTLPDKMVIAIGVALALITLGLYAPVLGDAFIEFDDNLYVTANPMVLQGLTWHGLVWALTTGHAPYWHPLTWLSHMTDCSLYGLDPAGHHATNALFHAVNTVLLFVFLRRMTGAVWRPAIVAALFGWHPLHVESVAWVAERKDVLSTFFFLWTIWAYFRYTEHLKNQPVDTLTAAEDGSNFKLFYGLSLFFFACGLMSKPMVVTLPFVLLLLDYWPLERFGPGSRIRLVVEKLPFFGLSAASCVVTYLVQEKSGAVTQFVPFSYRVGNALVSYGRYLCQAFWPVDLAIIYPYNKEAPRFDSCFCLSLLLAAITWLAVRCRQRRYLATGWLWYLGTLVPVIGFVQAGPQSSADRFTYIPLIGIFLMVVWGTADLAMKWRLPTWTTALPTGLVLTACAATTETQLDYWTDGGTLFRRALAVTTNNEVAWNGLGVYLITQHQEAEAFRCFTKALTIAPDNDIAWYNLGTYYWKRGRNAEAYHCFTESLRFKQRPAAFYHVGLVLTALHRSSEATEFFAKAVELEPDYIPARASLAENLSDHGKNEEAARQYREVLRQDPNQADAHCNLAYVLAAQGQSAEAMSELQQALRLRPSDAVSHCNLGNLLMEQGKLNQAADEYRAALHLRPNSPEIHSNLGAVLASQGRRQEAADEFNEALRIAPNFTQAKERLKALKEQ